MPHQPKLHLLQTLLDEDLALEAQINILREFQCEKISGELLGAAAKMLRERAITLKNVPENTVDLVGTGGDHSHTFNISTTAAFVVAGAGIPIAKHGNRSVTSRSGSFDCLEALKISISKNADDASKQLSQHGITFLFAPYFHPVIKKIMPARQALAKEKVKTIFNLLGPLLNPAQVKRIAVGVYQKNLIEPFIHALHFLGTEKAMVFHGEGLDEFSLTGETNFALLNHGTIRYDAIIPETLGLKRCALNDLHGGDAEKNAEICLQILSGEGIAAKRDMVILNAAVAIQVGHAENISLVDAIQLAKQSIDDGNAFEKLKRLSS